MNDLALAYHILRTTENAALKAAYWRGKGDKNSADQAATTAMRETLNALPISATVVIGEGEMDEAPMLYIGEKLGTGGPALDIAVDPLDGTTLCAKNRENSITVIAVSDRGSFLHAPDMYMLKLGVGPKARGAIDLNKDLTTNLKQIASALGKKPQDLNVVLLDRERHSSYLDEIRKFGAKATLITDGDVSPIVAAGMQSLDMDVLFGIGGAPEGVLAAAAAKCLGGDFQGKLWFENEGEHKRCKEMGLTDPDKVFTLNELVRSDNVIFALTGVTDGFLTPGVVFSPNEAQTHSLVIHSAEKILRKVQSIHAI